MSKFETPNGKEIATYVEPNSAMFRIKFVQGGELPTDLQGVFTSEKFADRAIKSYLLTYKKPTKEKV